MTADIFDPLSGEVQPAQIFVAVLAASGYTYAEATATQQLPDWIGAHCRAFAFFNGVSELLVPDNTSTGITKACFYEPDINPSYLDMAQHYGTVILPTRVRKPRDKALGEGAVLLVERWILARIRNETFFSLSELTEATRADRGSQRPALPKITRLSALGLRGDRPAGPQTAARTALPVRRMEKGDREHRLPRRARAALLQCLLPAAAKEARSALHREHRRMLLPKHSGRQPPTKLLDRTAHHPQGAYAAESSALAGVDSGALYPLGPEDRTGLCHSHPDHHQHPRASPAGLPRGVRGPAAEKSYDATRLEMACQRALDIGATSYRSLQSILKKGLERQGLCEPQPLRAIEHDNIRGATYYR